MLGCLLGELKEVFVNGNTVTHAEITQEFEMAVVKPEIRAQRLPASAR